MSDLDGIIKEFLVESYENLDQLDRDLVALEQDPQDQDRLGGIFRTIHTIKGTCGFFGFGQLEKVTHVGENLLSLLREGKLTLSAEITSGLLSLVDTIRTILADIESTGKEGIRDDSALIEQLTKLQQSAPIEFALPESQNLDESPKLDLSLANESMHDSQTGSKKRFGEILVEKFGIDPQAVEKALDQQKEGDSRRIGEILVENSAVPADKVKQVLASQNKATSSASEASIRVDVHLLDRLMNLVGELVLARNQILQFKSMQKDQSFLNTSQRLNLITSELQEGVMKTRMQQIGNIWSRFPRVIRDLSIQCEKQIHLEMLGKETELDKTVLEAIKDPLIHIIRNSVDHGIEAPEVRMKAGKSVVGHLQLRAYHEGGQVIIEITDDGRGIDPEKVKQKAVERGLLSPEQAANLSEHEAINLIFLPGFSTAETITNVSGRGVGMDVVKTNIEKIGGIVDLQSQCGRGTCIKIKIPLTLAIIPALIVSCAGNRYAIPQASLIELVRLSEDQAQRGIEHVHGAPVYRLRGNLLPLVSLQHVLEASTESVLRAEKINIVVLQADGHQFGLIVDSITDTEEIVVKSLGRLLKQIPVFAGATIMGDGRVALILDVTGIAQHAGVITPNREHALKDKNKNRLAQEGYRQPLLLCSVGGDRRFAIPLAQVTRLEEISRQVIECADTREVVQYRGQILPLFRLSHLLGISDRNVAAELMQVIVYSEAGRSCGLIVDKVLDIVDVDMEVFQPGCSQGVYASLVIQQRVTDLIDVRGLLHAIAPTLFQIAS